MFNIYDLKINVVFTTVATTLSYMLGGFDILLQTLLIFVIIDIVTGCCVAFFKSKNYKSNEMFTGLMRKCFIFMFLLVAVRLDMLFNSKDMIRTAVMFFYIANECLSILENLCKIGVPFPTFIKERMEEMKNNADKGVIKDE